MSDFGPGDRVVYAGKLVPEWKGMVGTVSEMWDGGDGCLVIFDDYGVGRWGIACKNLRHHTGHTFHVGDRVKYIGDKVKWKGHTGTITVLRGNDNDGPYVEIKWDDPPYGCDATAAPYEKNLMRIDEPRPFKVGDRVRYRGTFSYELEGRIGTVVTRWENGDGARIIFDGDTREHSVASISIEHYKDPGPAFHVGDRVTCVGTYRAKDSKNGTIKRLWESGTGADVQFDGDKYTIGARFCDLAHYKDPVAKLAVGDRVRYVGHVKEWSGFVGTVKGFDAWHIHVWVKWDDASFGLNSIMNEYLVPDNSEQPAAHPPFKQGDRVKIMDPGSPFNFQLGTVRFFSDTKVYVRPDTANMAYGFHDCHLMHLPAHVSNHRCTMDSSAQYVDRRELPTEHTVTVTVKPSPWLRKAIDNLAKKMDAEVKKGLAGQVADAEAEMCELRKRVEETLAENNRLNADCDKRRGENKYLNQECNRWHDRFYEALDERDALRAENAKLKDEAKTDEERIVYLTKARSELADSWSKTCRRLDRAMRVVEAVADLPSDGGFVVWTDAERVIESAREVIAANGDVC